MLRPRARSASLSTRAGGAAPPRRSAFRSPLRVGLAHLPLDLPGAVGVCLAQRGPLALVVPVEILAPALRPDPPGPGPPRPALETRARSSASRAAA